MAENLLSCQHLDGKDLVCGKAAGDDITVPRFLNMQCRGIDIHLVNHGGGNRDPDAAVWDMGFARKFQVEMGGGCIVFEWRMDDVGILGCIFPCIVVEGLKIPTSLYSGVNPLDPVAVCCRLRKGHRP